MHTIIQNSKTLEEGEKEKMNEIYDKAQKGKMKELYEEDKELEQNH